MKKGFLAVLCSCVSIIPASADTVSLSLDSCMQLAMQNNKTVQSAQKLAEKYGHEVKTYKANFFPNFKLVASDIWANSEGSVGGDIFSGVSDGVSQFLSGLTQIGHFDATNAYEMQALKQFGEGMADLNKGIDYKIGNIIQAGILVEQPIYMGGKVMTAYQMSKLGQQMAEQGAQLSQNEVIVQVQEAYALAVRANEMHKVAVRYDSLLQSLLVDVQNAEKHGLRSHNDVLKVQVKLSEAELQMRQAENGQRLATMNLCHYIGLPLTTQVVVDADAFAVAPDVQADRLADVSARPEYSILAMKSELAAKQVKIERAEYLPQVVLAGTYSYVDGFEVAGSKLFNKPAAAVMLNVVVPLYHANAGINKIRSSRLEAERAQLEQDDLIEKMNLELAQAANNLDEAFLEVELANKSLAQTEDNLRSSRTAYNLGTESLSDLLEAQTLWQQSYAKLANAKANLFVAATKYRKAAGRL
ncbi:MAG: TolC family protein [Bacteroidales bacterium]|nr:TolC family protein [Bacteroidales bacterium]